MEKMGYRNAGAVYELSRAGKLLKPRGGKITVNTMAELVLIDMALSSYDWDSEHKEPSRDAKSKGYPCRYYTKGWKTLAEDHGMMALSPEQVIGKSEEEVEAAMKAREGTAKVRIVQAWKFLATKDSSNVYSPPPSERTPDTCCCLVAMRRTRPWNGGRANASDCRWSGDSVPTFCPRFIEK